jgi:hypothetical protein
MYQPKLVASPETNFWTSDVTSQLYQVLVYTQVALVGVSSKEGLLLQVTVISFQSSVIRNTVTGPPSFAPATSILSVAEVIVDPRGIELKLNRTKPSLLIS